MKTKDITEKTGIVRETLRFYESKGLLPKLSRTESGFRVYPNNTVDRIKFIQMAKGAGFTLNEIKELIDLQQSRGACSIGRDIVRIKKSEIAERIKSLKRMDRVLTRFISACEENGVEGLKKPCHFSFDFCEKSQ
ncbi:MAG: hypothetical protein Fur0010_28490 [Bdellovibrio sp.]